MSLLNHGMARLYPLRFFLILLLLVALVVVVELSTTRLFGDQTLAPLLSLIVLAGLAYFFSPRQVLLAVPLFVCLSYFMIVDSSKYPLVRSSTVLVGGFVALWAAKQRARLSSQIEEVEAVLQSLPLPWILSDASGVITRHSATLIQPAAGARDLVGTSFFSYFNLTSKKEFIRTYMDAFDRNSTLPVIVLNALNSSKAYRVSFVFLSQKDGRRVLSVLQEQN